MSNVENFEEISKQLIAAAPTEKAAQFSARVINRIRAQGPAWIDANATEIQVTFVPDEALFPVADNRIFYLTRWQAALEFSI